MKRYVLYDRKRGFYVRQLDEHRARYSKDINKACIFDKHMAEVYTDGNDFAVEVRVDIRLA